MKKVSLAFLPLATLVLALLFSGVALADKPTPSPPAVTDNVTPGNACETPAKANTSGFSNPPGVGTGVQGGGTPPNCPIEHPPVPTPTPEPVPPPGISPTLEPTAGPISPPDSGGGTFVGGLL